MRIVFLIVFIVWTVIIALTGCTAREQHVLPLTDAGSS